MLDRVLNILKDQWRVLTFQTPSRAFVSERLSYLAFGLLVTWVAGLGRYWDHPSPEWYQRFGLISVIYVFLLAGVLWLVQLPVAARRQTYIGVLTFVTFTSAPAVLYAIPVERVTGMETAAIVTVGFLAVVAAWRVGLLVRYLNKACAIGMPASIVVAAFPIALILIGLGALNLTEVVMRTMAGIRTEAVTALSAEIIVILGFLTVFVSPIVALLYTGVAINRWQKNRRASGSDRS